mgnify:CR=1 FL=1
MGIIAERIRTAMNLRHMRQVDIIQQTGINKGSLSSYLSGKYIPKQNNIFLLAKALRVNESWLMGHDVPMELMDDSQIDQIYVNESKDNYHTKEELQLLSYYQLLNATGKAEALKRVHELTCIDTYTTDKEQ